jgi:hypothetical protein
LKIRWGARPFEAKESASRTNFDGSGEEDLRIDRGLPGLPACDGALRGTKELGELSRLRPSARRASMTRAAVGRVVGMLIGLPRLSRFLLGMSPSSLRVAPGEGDMMPTEDLVGAMPVLVGSMRCRHGTEQGQERRRPAAGWHHSLGDE